MVIRYVVFVVGQVNPYHSRVDELELYSHAMTHPYHHLHPHHLTDFLSAIGGETDALFYEGIGKDCPVCNDGKETCHECAGTGYIFSWTQSLAKNQTTSMHP